LYRLLVSEVFKLSQSAKHGLDIVCRNSSVDPRTHGLVEGLIHVDVVPRLLTRSRRYDKEGFEHEDKESIDHHEHRQHVAKMLLNIDVSDGNVTISDDDVGVCDGDLDVCDGDLDVCGGDLNV
jgi:hypothetical protein